jgi:hypothetical protein
MNGTWPSSIEPEGTALYKLCLGFTNGEVGRLC